MATLTEVVGYIRQRADRESDQHVVDATELIPVAVRAFREGWTAMLRACPSYCTTSHTFALTTSANTLALTGLSNTFVRAVKLERDDSGDGTYSTDLDSYELAGRNRLPAVAFTVYENTLAVEPKTEAAGNYRLWYVYRPADPVGATVINDPTGLLEQFMIDVGAIHCKVKSEEAAAEVAQLSAALERKMAAFAGPRMQRSAVSLSNRRYGFMRDRWNW